MDNPVNYFEVGTSDPVASKAFFGSLFGWSIADQASPQGYRMIGNDAGGLWDTSTMGDGNWAIFYVQVADVKAAVEKAESLGAKVAIPYTNGGGIEFAHLIDPQGNRFGVWRPIAA